MLNKTWDRDKKYTNFSKGNVMKRIALITGLILLLGFQASGQEIYAPEKLARLSEPIIVTDYHVVGPFLGGPRESLTNPMDGTFDRDTGMVDLNATYQSVYQFGGKISWQEQSTDESGNLVFNFDNPDWDKINDEWGVSGLYFLGAAYTSFESEEKCEALVNGHGIGSIYINGRRYSGDPYGHRLIQTPVVLDEGTNHVFFMTGGFGGSDTVKFEVLPAPETELIVLERDILVPDIVKGEEYYGLAGIPILNTTNRWIDNVHVNGEYRLEHPIAPLTVLNVPVFVGTDDDLTDWEEDRYDIPLTITWDGGIFEINARPRVRTEDQSRIVTFRSTIDNSAQKYAIKYPLNYDPSKDYALIFSSHGAGVACEGQVDAFGAKDWAFIVAPTNRRRFGFDWQDWGRLDAIEILDRVQAEYPIDLNRTYLIGHSMGGHGAWHIGSTHADRFAAIVPSAGWDSFQLYMPWFLRSDELFSDPMCERIFDQCANADRTTRLLPNLRNVPVLAVHGGADDNVPPTHARLLTGILERMDYDVRLWEEAGQGHWWDAHPGIPGTDCVDALRIQSFCKERVRDEFPKHVTFVSYDLGNNLSSYWLAVFVKIHQIGRVYADAEICGDGWINVITENVEVFSLHKLWEIDDNASRYRIRIDGQELPVFSEELASEKYRYWGYRKYDDGTWYYDNEANDVSTGASKLFPYFGPIKRAYYKPFRIVVGQSGTEEQNELNMEIARGIANRWWYRANGFAYIVTDFDFPGNFGMSPSNLILIGGPDSNSISDFLSGEFPFEIGDDGVMMGDAFIEGEDLACNFVYPIGHYSMAHCIWGNSIEGMRLSGGLTPLYSGSNLPDFMIFDDDVKLLGSAGVRAAGFFDNDWQLDEEYYYLRR